MCLVLRKCSKCCKEKPIDCFSKNNTKKSGYQSSCKECANSHHRLKYDHYKEAKKIYIENNRELIHQKDKDRYIKNYEKIRSRKHTYYTNNAERINSYRKTPFGRAVHKNSQNKRRSKIKNGDITSTQILLLIENSKRCYYCNVELLGIKFHLDHYIPLSKGGLHTISNLVVACSSCNLKKSNKMPNEFHPPKPQM